jgi:hypothetical protein
VDERSSRSLAREEIIQTAWTMPGMYPKIVSRMLIQKCRPKPTVSRTPTGGSRIAKITRMMFNLRLHGAWGGCCPL